MAPQELNGLLRVAGPAVAAELLFEGRILNATEAYHKGLVTRVVEGTALAAEVQRSIAHILQGPPGVGGATSQLIGGRHPPGGPLGRTGVEHLNDAAEAPA